MLPALVGDTLIDSASTVTVVDPVAPVLVALVPAVPEVAANTPVFPVEIPNSDSNSRRVHASRLISNWAPGGAAGGLALCTRLSKVDNARVTIVVATVTGLAMLFATGVVWAATVTPAEAVAAAATTAGAEPLVADCEVSGLTCGVDTDRGETSESRDFAAADAAVRDPDRATLAAWAAPRADDGRVARELRPVPGLPCDDAVAEEWVASLPAASACAVPMPAIAVPIPRASAKPPIRPIHDA